MDIEKFIKKQDSALKRYMRLYILLDLAVVFLLLYTVFIVLNMEKLFALISTFELYTGTTYNIAGSDIAFETLGLVGISLALSLLITIILHIRDKKARVIKLIESKYPRLNERLSTAYDNRRNSNVIVDELMGEVTKDTSRVKSSQFLNKRRLGIVFGMLLVTSSVFAYVTVNDLRSDFSPEDLPEIIEELPLISPEEETGELLPELGQDGSNGDGGEDIFGEPAIIVVEGTEVDLTIPPGAGIGFTLGEEGEERTEEFEIGSAYDIGVVSSQAYYEELPEGYQSVIKAYFEELAKE